MFSEQSTSIIVYHVILSNGRVSTHDCCLEMLKLTLLHHVNTSSFGQQPIASLPEDVAE